MVLPTGQHDPNRIINLGLNRAAFKPEAAIIRNYEHWMVEIYGGAWLFTSNDDFAGGHVRSQDPPLSVQSSLRRTFRTGLWVSEMRISIAAGARTWTIWPSRTSSRTRAPGRPCPCSR